MDGNTADYSKDFPKGTLKGVKATYPGAELTSDFKARLLKTNPKLKRLHLRSRVVRRDGADRPRGDLGQVRRPDDVRAGHHQGLQGRHRVHQRSRSARPWPRRARTSTTTVSPVPIDLGNTGSPTKATIGIFQYDADNKYKNLKYVAGVI